MNIDIRKNIIDNFKGCTENEIRDSIDDSILDKEEVTLPGLGVFFELLWKNSDAKLRNTLICTIKKGL